MSVNDESLSIAEPEQTAPSAEAPAEDPLARHAAELEALRAEVAALKNDVLRARAEVDNQRKRAERDVEAAHKYGLERFVQDLLPVKDSLDLGARAALAAPSVDALREGMSLTIKMFDDFFAKLNVTRLHPEGERFDPQFHQAMTLEESASVAPGSVTRVMQSGYLLNQRLLRPALVVVAKEAQASTPGA
jgi:molecular chaperone GrpE